MIVAAEDRKGPHRLGANLIEAVLGIETRPIVLKCPNDFVVSPHYGIHDRLSFFCSFLNLGLSPPKFLAVIRLQELIQAQQLCR
jgi:hypothetical protein